VLYVAKPGTASGSNQLVVRIPPTMKRLHAALLVVAFLFLATVVVLLPALASAQQPSPPLPGDVPEAARPIPYWLSYPVLAGAAGLLLFLGFMYWRLSSRFYGREEPPPVRQRPRYAGMSRAQPVAAAPQGAATAQPGAAAAARAEAPGARVTAPTEAAQPAAAPAPARAPEAAAPEKPAAPAAPEKPPAAPAASTSAGGKVEQDQETFDRVLQEQLDKGVDRRVAEGRAKAAAVRAAREKAGAG
jgi:hypothetical protein